MNKKIDSEALHARVEQWQTNGQHNLDLCEDSPFIEAILAQADALIRDLAAENATLREEIGHCIDINEHHLSLAQCEHDYVVRLKAAKAKLATLEQELSKRWPGPWREQQETP